MSQIVSLSATAERDGDTIVSSLEPAGPPESVGRLLARNASRFADHPVCRLKGNGRFHGTTWRDFLVEVASFAKFLVSVGVGPGDRVAVVSRNRVELLVTEFAVMGLGAIHVPIFAGYAAGQLSALIAQCGAKVVVVSRPSRLDGVELGDEVETVVSYDPVESDCEKAAAGRDGRAIVGFGEAMRSHALRGPDDPAVRRFLDTARAVDPRQACLMMYTSGTAGRQKGVVLCHDNILSQQQALARIWSVTAEDRFLSYLPWHHSFGGIFEKYTGLYNGAPLALDESFGKDFPLLLENWKEIRPTVYFSVPMVYQELWNHVRAHPEDEDRIFHDELRFVFTAAAPLPANISEYFAERKIAVVEGWGLTETSPCCTVTDMREPRSVPGVVGYPIPGVDIRVAEDGEILVRGRNVMLGYHSDDEATGRAFPGDGWFHTGDLGEFTGVALKLLARKDRVFKLLNAEKVVPTILENALAGRDRYIKHVVIVGSGKRSLAALIFPNFAVIEQEFGADRQVAADAVKESYRQSIVELNRVNPVKYEHIQAFAVVDRELTLEEDELTPSMKVRVQNVLCNSDEFVEAIYDPLDDCACRFLAQVVRVDPDPRACPRGKDRTIDRCHDCGSFSFGGALGQTADG